MAYKKGTTFTPDTSAKKESESSQKPTSVIEKNPMFTTVSFDKYRSPSKRDIEISLGLGGGK